MTLGCNLNGTRNIIHRCHEFIEVTRREVGESTPKKKKKRKEKKEKLAKDIGLFLVLLL